MKLNLKLINNEVIELNRAQTKGCYNNRDTCTRIDAAFCTVQAVDECDYDYNSCIQVQFDICETDGCYKDTK